MIYSRCFKIAWRTVLVCLRLYTIICTTRKPTCQLYPVVSHVQEGEEGWVTTPPSEVPGEWVPTSLLDIPTHPWSYPPPLDRTCPPPPRHIRLWNTHPFSRKGPGTRDIPPERTQDQRYPLLPAPMDRMTHICKDPGLLVREGLGPLGGGGWRRPFTFFEFFRKKMKLKKIYSTVLKQRNRSLVVNNYNLYNFSLVFFHEI